MRSKNSLSKSSKISFQDFLSCFLLVKLLEKHGNFQSSGKFMRQWFLNERITSLSLVWITQLRDAWLSLGQMRATFSARYWKKCFDNCCTRWTTYAASCNIWKLMLHKFWSQAKTNLVFKCCNECCMRWPLHAIFPATTFPCRACALIRFL